MKVTKVLIVSVGGSFEPVVTAIKTIKPDRAIFLCSGGNDNTASEKQVTGNDNPCEKRIKAKDKKNGKGKIIEITYDIVKLPNIITQTGITEKFNEDSDLIIVDNPDDFDECYKKIEEKILQIRKDNPGCYILADYTGGTKTMSSALSMAALDYNISALYVTTAGRKDLIKVESGEFPKRIGVQIMHHRRRIKGILPQLLKRFDYPAAIDELNTILTECEWPDEKREIILSNLYYLKAFDAWDRFDHLGAINLLKFFMNDKHDKIKANESGLFLKKVIASRSAIDKDFKSLDNMNGHGYEVVEDLILNAERRACQEKYDDAVGRLYRATEALAQIRLKKEYDIETGNIDMNNEHLSDDIKKDLEKMKDEDSGKDKIKLALSNSYDLLFKLKDDLGENFKKSERKIKNVLKTRNGSILAHGFKPVTLADYNKIYNVITVFIKENFSNMTGQSSGDLQFPTSVNLEI